MRLVLVSARANSYTSAIGAAQAAWSAERVRCIFSVSLNESTLDVSPGAAPAPATGHDPLRAAISPLRSVLDALVTTVFPSDCRVCKGPHSRSSLLPVCAECLLGVPRQAVTMCRVCGDALDFESAWFAGQFPADALLCHECHTAAPMFERAVAYAVYQDEVREMIHLLKYQRMHRLAGPLGKMLANAILPLEAEAAQDLIVVAVPLFRSKQRQRGYNQAEVLADAAITELSRIQPTWRLRAQHGLLQRRRDTRSQFELSSAGRRRNVESAFEVDRNALRPGCEVLLIDDIYTTGATARECSRALRRAGAGKVWVATLARAQTPRVAMWEDTMQRVPQGFV